MSDEKTNPFFSRCYPAMEWKLAWTLDGEHWHEAGFTTYVSARDFAHGLMEDQEGNDLLRFTAYRMQQVRLSEFLDVRRSATDVHVLPGHVFGR